MAPTTTTTARPASPTLARLLDDELAVSPTFGGRYSNHLAMALAALDQMGAPPETLERTFRAHLRGESEPREDGPDLAARLAEVARDGIDAVVRRRAPALSDAPGTALFHPLIRLAYGLDAGHEGQVAAALLDWEKRRQPLPVPTGPPGAKRLADVAAALRAHPADTWPSGFDMRGVAARPELAAAVEGLAVDERTLDDAVEFALLAHVAAGDFVTLHCVTGARALQRVSQVLDEADARPLAAAASVAMAVAYVIAGAPPLPDRAALDHLRAGPLPAAAEVTERAIASRDPHVIKLANVALVEEARTGDPLYRVVGARVVGLAPG